MHFRRVAEREPGLESAPAADEGSVTEVEFGFRHETALPGSGKECQVCQEPVDVSAEHIRANVRVFQGESVSVDYRHQCPVFCSPECWTEWASG